MADSEDDEGAGVAGELLLEAARLAVEGRGRSDVGTALVEHVRAKLAEPELGAGNELIQWGNGDANGIILNTLDHPDSLSAEASERRLLLAKRSGALTLAIDTADTLDAKNSAEIMLAHQLAAAHTGVMRLSGQLNTLFVQDLAANSACANVRATRLAGSIARLMGAYQQGLLTFQRLRSGATQTVVVQHVSVGEGGQAVVAGKMKTGGPAARSSGAGGDGNKSRAGLGGKPARGRGRN